MSRKTKKYLSGIVAVLCVAAILLTGTFAWKDFRQHSLNTLEALDAPDVRLNDSNKPPTSWNDSTNSYVEKKVSVTNTGNSTSPVFVRLQFSEYLQSYTVNYEVFVMDGEVPVLFATHADGPKIGEYLCWDSEAEAISGLATLGLALPPYALDHDNDPQTPDKWYARTVNEELQNGVYGKPMQDPAAATAKTRAKLFGGVERVKMEQDIQRGPFPYKVHKWDGTSICDEKVLGSPPDYYAAITDADKNTISDYISWDMGIDVMTYQEWVNDGQRILPRWVLAEDGWCYWATYLPIGDTTANIMEAVRLVQMPDDALDYEIHISLQAITQNELNDETVWADMGSEMRQNLKNTLPTIEKRQALKNLVDALRKKSPDDYTTSSWQAMIVELESAEILLANENATYQMLEDKLDSLTKADQSLVRRANKSALETLIQQVEGLVQTGYTPDSWELMRQQLNVAKIVMQNADADQNRVNQAYTSLDNARRELVRICDRTGLGAAIAEAKTYKQEDWSAATWGPFNIALSNASVVYGNNSTTPEQVQDALDKLLSAQNALRADKAKLKALMEQVDAYDKSSISTGLRDSISDAYSQALNIYNAPSSKQAQVDEVYNQLKEVTKFILAKKGDLVKMKNGEEWRVL